MQLRRIDDTKVAVIGTSPAYRCRSGVGPARPAPSPPSLLLETAVPSFTDTADDLRPAVTQRPALLLRSL
jgi:hypothetical protein